jgi:hypothetical protein
MTANESRPAWWTNKKTRALALAAAGALGALLIGLSLYALGKTYLLDPAIQDTTQLIPRNAVLFAEVRDPAALLALWHESTPGRLLAHEPAYQNLRGTPEWQRFDQLIYLLELKTGLQLGNLVAGQDRPVAVALMPDGSLLAVARTDLKSRLGIALLRSLKGKTIELPNEQAFESPPSGNAADADSAATEAVVNQSESPPTLIERRSELGNLSITRIDLGSRSLFLVMLGDVLFLSDRLDTLEDSLTLAGSPRARSLATLHGMPAARAALAGGGDGRALFYLAPRGGSWAPFVAFLGGANGLIAVLRARSDAPASVDLFEAGPSRLQGLRDAARQNAPDARATQPRAVVPWRNFLPRDSVAQLYSTLDTPADLLKYFDDLGDVPEKFSSRAREFTKAANIQLTSEQGSVRGLCFVFHGFQRDRLSLYPHFSLSYGDDEDHLLGLGAALFGDARRATANFQHVAYTHMLRADRVYEPAIASVRSATAPDAAAVSFLATHDEYLKRIIGAAGGARPGLGDAPTFRELGQFANAPLHVIVNLNEARLALRQFLVMGADRSDSYTEKTIDRDVMPLLDAFRAYGWLHLATGVTGERNGRIVPGRN